MWDGPKNCLEEGVVAPSWVFWPWLIGWFIAIIARNKLKKKWFLKEQDFGFINKV